MAPAGGTDDVVLEVPVGAVVVVLVGAVVDDVVDDVGLVVVVVVVLVVDAGGLLLTRLPTLVPPPAPPKMSDSGLPEMSSIAVMNSSASTKTMPAIAAIDFHDHRIAPDGRASAAEATSRSVAGAPATAETSRRWVRAAGVDVVSIRPVSSLEPEPENAPVPAPAPASPTVSTTSVGAVPLRDVSTASVGANGSTTVDVPPPLEPVEPSRRSSVAPDASGTRSTTWRTASCPRSIDWATNAVPIVAAADPIATPTIVPLTPKLDAIRAAMTAPAAEARICRTENFTPGLSSRPPPASRRGR